jgi:hypothetical protein
VIVTNSPAAALSMIEEKPAFASLRLILDMPLS